MPVNVRSDDIDVRDDKVVIDNSDLKELVEKDKDQAVELLRSEVGEVNVDDIDFDDSGRLVINNKAFADSLKKKMSRKSAPDDENVNVLCPNYQC